MEKHDMLRSYIKAFIEKKLSKKSAGVVITTKQDGVWKVLILKDVLGRFDITKGIVEENESYFNAAIREANEEAGIILTHENFIWGQQDISYGSGVAFVAYVENHVEPKLLPNPETGKVEHESWAWLSFAEARNKIIHYLLPAIEWAEHIVNGEE